MAATEAAGSAEPQQHPLELGSRATCRRSSTAPPTECDIIEREYVNGAWRYYVHHDGTDRRLDSWLGEEGIILDQPATGAASTNGLPAAGVGGVLGNGRGGDGSRRATRNMKRKSNEINHVQKEGVNTYDEALEKEHEESTKVRGRPVTLDAASAGEHTVHAPHARCCASRRR